METVFTSFPTKTHFPCNSNHATVNLHLQQDSTTLARPSSTNGTGETESKPRVGRVKGRRRTNSSARLADDGDGEAGMPSSNSASNIHVLSVNKSADFSKGPKEQTPHGGSHPISSGRRPSKGQLPQLLPLHSQR
eukprot:TRINITY_DN9291_c0_g1_i3.p1 TRINITY_DN9291_c0_g1~~TRINITY_DN9291_c0_g1_i3.p1  ORF type:complete len:135 (-),score=16.31 TRINITY_DN9291_c0_g1_i3:285-689(-)